MGFGGGEVEGEERGRKEKGRGMEIECRISPRWMGSVSGARSDHPCLDRWIVCHLVLIFGAGQSFDTASVYDNATIIAHDHRPYSLLLAVSQMNSS